MLTRMDKSPALMHDSLNGAILWYRWYADALCLVGIFLLLLLLLNMRRHKKASRKAEKMLKCYAECMSHGEGNVSFAITECMRVLVCT